MRKILLVSHGDFSKGILNTAKMIVGDMAEAIETYSLYPGKNPNDFVSQFEKELDPHNDYIIIADLIGGSVHTAFCSLLRYSNIYLFSGMNLNMILELLLTSEENTEEACKKAIESAKKGIILKNGMENMDQEDEEF